MKWYGLTGGIATGKSTVSAMFTANGVRVIDADQVAREVVAVGSPTLARLVDTFGSEILHEDGSLDRVELGERVFSDFEQLTILNSITHPAIAARTGELLDLARQQGEAFVIYDAALIVENGIHRLADGLIVVALPLSLQLQRLMDRDHLEETAARQRISTQMPLGEKLLYADWIIDNSGDIAATEQQVQEVLSQLRLQIEVEPSTTT